MGRAVFRPKLAMEIEMTKRFLRGEITRKAAVRCDIGEEFAGDIQAEARGDFKESPKPGRINKRRNGTAKSAEDVGKAWASQDHQAGVKSPRHGSSS